MTRSAVIADQGSACRYRVGFRPPIRPRVGKISLVVDVASRFKRLRDRHEWVDHLVRAGARHTQRRGKDYAAAVTYFSALSLVPVTMVAFAAAAPRRGPARPGPFACSAELASRRAPSGRQGARSLRAETPRCMNSSSVPANDRWR
jgi:hypothetical protein